MSTSAKRAFLFGGLLAIGLTVLGALGFYSGLHQSRQTASHTPSASAPPTRPLVLDTPYHITQPSVGMLQRTLPVTIETQDGQFIAAIDDPAVTAGMAVILYDAAHQAYPLKGIISEIANNRAVITQHNVFADIVSGDIVMAENFMARRLPRDSYREGHIWKAVPNGDETFTARSIALPEPTLFDARFFHTAGDVRADEFVIADPNDRLEDGAILTALTIVENDARALTPDEAARHDQSDAQVARLLHVIEMAPGAGASLPSAPGGTECYPSSSPIPQMP